MPSLVTGYFRLRAEQTGLIKHCFMFSTTGVTKIMKAIQSKPDYTFQLLFQNVPKILEQRLERHFFPCSTYIYLLLEQERDFTYFCHNNFLLLVVQSLLLSIVVLSIADAWYF